MSEPNLPANKMLVAYWLNAETTNTFACPTARNIPCYTLKSGGSQINVVNLVGASFAGTSGNFQSPYFSYSPSLLNVLENGDVGALQSAGIKVVLTVQGNGATNGNGWSCLPESANQDFANWVQSDVIEKYGLDGIDIDDEFSHCTDVPQQLVNTVAWMRSTMPDIIISKALWQDLSTFTLSATTSAAKGQTLGQLLTYGCTMGYGWGLAGFISAAESYKNNGLPYSKICLGVQPGVGSWMTPLTTTKEVTEWAIANKLLGMMFWTFSQDIQQFTSSTQYVTPYMNSGDHQWQETMINTMWGSGQYVVNQSGLTGPYIPWGNYRDSVSDIKVTLSATCTANNVTGSLDITNATTGDITNNNGVLQQSATGVQRDNTLGAYVPSGSYQSNSSNIKVVLSATCKNSKGQPVSSSLDVTSLGWGSYVENIDGVLTVVNTNS